LSVAACGIPFEAQGPVFYRNCCLQQSPWRHLLDDVCQNLCGFVVPTVQGDGDERIARVQPFEKYCPRDVFMNPDDSLSIERVQYLAGTPLASERSQGESEGAAH